MPAQSPEPHDKQDVHTASIDSAVNTSGGPFTGRNQTIYHVREEALFTQAIAVAKIEDKVTLTLDPTLRQSATPCRCWPARANAVALACKVDEAIALYRQVCALDPKFSPSDPQTIVPVLAHQKGCK